MEVNRLRESKGGRSAGIPHAVNAQLETRNSKLLL